MRIISTEKNVEKPPWRISRAVHNTNGHTEAERQREKERERYTALLLRPNAKDAKYAKGGGQGKSDDVWSMGRRKGGVGE